MPGFTLIADFDGTIAHLPVDWATLRARVGASSIDELWGDHDDARWALVRDAETDASGRARPPDTGVRDWLDRADEFVVMSANSEHAIAAYFARLAGVVPAPRCIVGRETLGGPKRDRDVFAAGVARCRRALTIAPSVYLGDQTYELDFATDLGFTVVDLASTPGGRPGA